MNVIQGNLLDLAEQGRFDVIVHGCNCLHTMGAGLAAQVRLRWPEVFNADLETPRSFDKLGRSSICHVVRNGLSFYVVNAYTQTRPGPYADLVAIREVFEQIKRDHHGSRIGYPRIGAGLGGLQWGDVAAVLDEVLAGEDHSVVEWSGP